MKTFFLLFLLLPIYSFCGFSVGNPSNPFLLQRGFFLSDEGGFALKASLDMRVFKEEKLHFRGDQEDLFSRPKERGFSSLLFALVNLKERVELYGGGGISETHLHFSKETGCSYSLKSGKGPLWVGGIRALLLEMGNSAFGVDAKYGFFSSKEGSLSSSSHHHLDYLSKGWQIGAALSHQWSLFIPYAGAVIGKIKTKVSSIKNEAFHSLRIESNHRLTFFGGITLATGSFASFNVEGFIGRERALSLTGEVRF